MAISKNISVLFVVLTFLCGVGLFYTVVYPNLKEPAAPPVTGVSAFLQRCAPKDSANPDCASISAIQKAFGFDTMTEINGRYQKMKKTADDIAKGKLTDDMYDACLKSDTCVKVPMLDPDDDPNTPHAKAISKVFWQIVEGHSLTPEICALIPVCVVALQNKAVIVLKNRIATPRVKKS